MLGLNIAFPADSSSCRVVQKLERFEVGGVELVKVTARKSVWNPGTCGMTQLPGLLVEDKMFSLLFQNALEASQGL